jgi:hypothetical protein
MGNVRQPARYPGWSLAQILASTDVFIEFHMDRTRAVCAETTCREELCRTEAECAINASNV